MAAGLDHVGIAVPSLAQALPLWRSLAGEPDGPPELVPSNRVRVAFLRFGETHVELLEPADGDSPVGRFLASRGPGLHHLAFRVPSVDHALEEVRAHGGRTVDTVARAGARGRKVGFAHPSAYAGTLVEFVEAP
jgi:methylmalonyl-CoA epimerase